MNGAFWTYDRCYAMALRLAGKITLGMDTDSTWSVVGLLVARVAKESAEADERVKSCGHADAGAFDDWRPLRRLMSHPIYTRPLRDTDDD